MSLVKLWPVEFARLSRAPLTRAAVVLSLLCPVLGYTFFTPPGRPPTRPSTSQTHC